MHIPDPDKLSSEEYNARYAQLLYLIKWEREFQLSILKQAISEVLGGVNNNSDE